MVIDHELHVVHNLSIAAVSFLGRFLKALSIAKDSRGLGIENERHS